eukprot:235355_1
MTMCQSLPQSGPISKQKIMQKKNSNKPQKKIIKEAPVFLPSKAIKHQAQISTLCAVLNSKPSYEELQIIDQKEINAHKLKISLQKFRKNATFQKYNTYNMVINNMPSFIVLKQKVNRNDNDQFGWGASETYHDIYGSDKKRKQIHLIMMKYIELPDIVDIILQYSGTEQFLFSIKTSHSGGGFTFSTSTLSINDVLSISDNYSEKSGSRKGIKINKKYDKKILMYLAWIVSELSIGYFKIDFQEFMKYEIKGYTRPKPIGRNTLCIVGYCMIVMENGFKCAKDIRVGDIVRTSNGSLAKVKCTITQRIDDVIEICRFGKCLVTPEHPIRKIGNKEWIIPELIQCVEVMYVEQVNNFILELGHNVVVDNVECITLAHNLEDETVKHPIWGSDVISRFLESFSSYPNVVIDGSLNDKMLHLF